MDLGEIPVLDGLQRPSRKCLEPRRTARQRHVVLAACQWRIFSAAVLGEFSRSFCGKLRACMHPDRLQPFRERAFAAAARMGRAALLDGDLLERTTPRGPLPWLRAAGPVDS